LYGAGEEKLGNIVKGSRSDGAKIVDTFFRNVPGLKRLIDGVKYEYKHNHGRLLTIDGGFVLCASVNAALNYKIQSAGAIVMKLTSILLDKKARQECIDFRKVGDIHDEGQLEVLEREAERLGTLAVDSIREAGVLLKFNVGLSGDYKIGKDWSQTH
jgi:DNA polymerase I-like protein with 3'-5' exonuclease and polymerase domains